MNGSRAGRPLATDPLQRKVELLASVSLFAALDGDTLATLAATAVERRHQQGQTLFAEGDPGDELHVLCVGSVALFRAAPGGVRHTLSMLTAPDVLSEVALLDGARRSASAQALDYTVTLGVPRPALLTLIRSQPLLLEAVFQLFAGMVRRLTDQNSDYVFLDLPGRVAKTLVRLGAHSQEQPPVVDVPQALLAEMVGGSRQSVNQAIGGFTERGWVRRDGRQLLVENLPALRRRAGLDRRTGPAPAQLVRPAR